MGVFIVTTKNTNDTKGGLNKQTTEDTAKDTQPSYEPSAGEQGNDIDLATKNEEKHENEYSFSEEVLSEPVRDLLGLDGVERNYNSLGDAVGKLSKDLSADDVAALRDFLTWSNDRFPEGMRDIEVNAIKNNVLDRLLRQNTLPEGIGLQLVDMASDLENDPVWRDYCIQFMTPFYERAAGEKGTTKDTKYTKGMDAGRSGGSGESVDELNRVREAMMGALDERDSTLAGTALIGAELLSRTHEEFDRKAIVEKASEIAADEEASAASRMTALRLSASENLKSETGNVNGQVADTARSLAQTGETILLRSAAIVTLGETGTEDDRELLESFAGSEDRQIAAAAELALQEMDAANMPVVDLSVPATVSETAPSQPAQKLPPVLIN